MRYCLADLTVDSREALPELAASADPADVTIDWPESLPSADTRWFHAWPDVDGTDWVRFGRRGDVFELEFPHARFLVSGDGAHVDVVPVGDAPVETLRHLLLNQVMPLVLSRRGRIVLHASAVSHDGVITVFAGATDAGKSTLAAACCTAGARHAADDAVVLTREAEGRWRVMPIYAGLRLWPASATLLGWPEAGDRTAHYSTKWRFEPSKAPVPFETAHLPLERIVVLASPAGGVPRLLPLSGHRATLMIVTHLFRIDADDAQETVRLFDAIAEMTPAIRVFRFESDHPAEDAPRWFPEFFTAAP